MTYDDATTWVEQLQDEADASLASIADWGPAEDWSEWHIPEGDA